jgi:selenide, water dikinase
MNVTDDAAVYRLSDDLAVVETVDFFTPIVDDPYDFGRIAAANALSDIYAMGATPLFALNLVAFPKTLPMDILGEILRGGQATADAAGISVLGGHSIDDPEPKYGMAVTGVVAPDRVITKAGGKAGDVLVLTKPLGTGIVTTALKRGLATDEEAAEVTDWMARLNREASEAARAVGVDAMTDVTGFGLLGHLREMCEASGTGAEVTAMKVPRFAGLEAYVSGGVYPGGTKSNLEYAAAAACFDETVTQAEKLILADAQTSGGLLIAVAQAKAPALLEELGSRGVLVAEAIGRLTAPPSSAAEPRIRIVSG